MTSFAVLEVERRGRRWSLLHEGVELVGITLSPAGFGATGSIGSVDLAFRRRGLAAREVVIEVGGEQAGCLLSPRARPLLRLPEATLAWASGAYGMGFTSAPGSPTAWFPGTIRDRTMCALDFGPTSLAAAAAALFLAARSRAATDAMVVVTAVAAAS